jgi:tight adherence protein C
MVEWVWMAVIFVTVASFAFVAMRRSVRSREQLDKRLRSPDEDEAVKPVLGALTPAVAAQIPITRKAREELQQELLAAGFYRSGALLDYAAFRVVLVLVCLVTAGVLALIVRPNQVPGVLIGGVVMALLGFSLPRIYLYARGRRRARQIARSLPFAVDLLTLCLSAGQNLLGALHWVARDLRFSQPEMAMELEITRKHAELHSVEYGLRQLADRVRVPEIRDLTMILIQSERLGTDTAAALLEFSNSFRVALRQRAEAQANRASFWMLLPTLFCLWIGAAILLIGPVYLDFWQRRRSAVDFLKEASSSMEKASRGPQAPPSTSEEPVP